MGTGQTGKCAGTTTVTSSVRKMFGLYRRDKSAHERSQVNDAQGLLMGRSI